MKKNTYRCEDGKYKELQLKLVQDEMSWQGFVDKAVDDYLEGNYNPKGEKEMKIIEIVELNQKGINVKEQNNDFATRYFDDNSGLPEGNFDEGSIAGTWVQVKGKHEFEEYAYRSIDNSTLVPEKVFRDYMINELAGNYLDVDIDWLRKNDEEMIDWVRKSEYWDAEQYPMEDIINNLWMRIYFSDNGTGYTFTSDTGNIDVNQCLVDQPNWGEDEWSEWKTEDIAKYYNEFINQS